MQLVVVLIPLVLTALAQLGALAFIGWSVWQDPEPARRTVNQLLGGIGNAAEGAGEAAAGLGEGAAGIGEAVKKSSDLLPIFALGGLVLGAIYLTGGRRR